MENRTKSYYRIGRIGHSRAADLTSLEVELFLDKAHSIIEPDPCCCTLVQRIRRKYEFRARPSAFLYYFTRNRQPRCLSHPTTFQCLMERVQRDNRGTCLPDDDWFAFCLTACRYNSRRTPTLIVRGDETSLLSGTQGEEVCLFTATSFLGSANLEDPN